ncbi:Holliday junction resolvase RuvX [Nocardioides sp.]|uniref:Holliday junction resolvase RuvX n=1 Tax=Nocardioides sp. TaxID=35761 RepID=UPI003511BAA5
MSEQVEDGGPRPFRYGVRLGLDPGDARIGVARCDAGGVLCSPVDTVPRGPGDLKRIRRLIREHEPIEVIVGLPRSLSGREGPAADKVREFAQRLADSVRPLPVRLCDERLTTVSAEAMLRERGRHGADRRSVVDMAAAVVILQSALDRERGTGAPPGELVHTEETP